MSQSERSDSSGDLDTLQANAIELVRTMTEPRTAERTTPLEISSSRARSPSSPTSTPSSPLTPIPLSPVSSPADMACDENEPMVDINLADPEASLGKMPAAVDEFENHTALARELSRKACVEDLQHDSPGPEIQRVPNARDPREEDMTELKGEAPPSRDQIVSQARRPEAQSEGEILAEPEQEATPIRKQAAWVTEAVAACQANKKNLLNKGKVFVVLDTADLTKSYLLDVNTFCNVSEDLEKLYLSARGMSSSCISAQGLEGMLVLSPASTPELVAETLDATIESALPTQPSHKTRITRSAKVKAESDQEDDSPAANDSELPKTDWPKAYESFFRIIAGKKHGISRHDLSAALPQIQGVVRIAQKYSAIHAVESTFVGLLLGYVEHHTLYSTIEKWPAHCLNLGIALKSRLVYDEAFKHLVGYNANFKDGRVFPDLSDDIQAMIQRRSFELYSVRRDVEEKLMLMTLPGNKKDGDYPSQYVSQHDQRMAYNTVNIFRDWIAWHIGHLRQETEAEPAPFYLCEHANSCINVAGFYQTIAAHDYLDADEVYDNFGSHYKSARNAEDELEAVSQALESLKATASEHVEKLSESTLHLADRSGLRYLTCVEVDAVEDVPWDTGSDEDSSDEDEDMDEDSD